MDKTTIERIQKQFERDPSLLRKDEKFAQQYLITRMLSAVDVSINALDAVIEPESSPIFFHDLKEAWDKFLKNAKIVLLE